MKLLFLPLQESVLLLDWVRVASVWVLVHVYHDEGLVDLHRHMDSDHLCHPDSLPPLRVQAILQTICDLDTPEPLFLVHKSHHGAGHRSHFLAVFQFTVTYL
jgi:hypothetical protein